jgi:hypothetical protein
VFFDEEGTGGGEAAFDEEGMVEQVSVKKELVEVE